MIGFALPQEKPNYFLFLYNETKKLNENASKFLISYILFSLFATILSLTIYFMNLS